MSSHASFCIVTVGEWHFRWLKVRYRECFIQAKRQADIFVSLSVTFFLIVTERPCSAVGGFPYTNSQISRRTSGTVSGMSFSASLSLAVSFFIAK